MRRYRCIDARKADGFDVRSACAVMEVSKSAYYDWVANGRPDAGSVAARDIQVLAEIRAIHAALPTTAPRG